MRYKFFIIFLLTIILTPVYAFKVEPNLVKINHINIGNSQTEKELKVVQISDIQVSEEYDTSHLDQIIKKVNSENPDLIVFTGDLFDNYAKYSHELEITQKLNELHSKIGKFAVWGNHDYGGGAAQIFERVMTNGGFTVLKNYGETIELKSGKRLFIGGLDDSLLGNPSVSQTLAYRQNADFSILLTHEPDVADKFVGFNTQLILAGHSHGGQIKLPFYEVKNVLAKKYTHGLYTLSDGAKLYVNTGLGTTSIHARLGVIPEVSSFSIHF